jgi:hypothetical protein
MPRLGSGTMIEVWRTDAVKEDPKQKGSGKGKEPERKPEDYVWRITTQVSFYLLAGGFLGSFAWTRDPFTAELQGAPLLQKLLLSFTSGSTVDQSDSQRWVLSGLRWLSLHSNIDAAIGEPVLQHDIWIFRLATQPPIVLLIFTDRFLRSMEAWALEGTDRTHGCGSRRINPAKGEEDSLKEASIF